MVATILASDFAEITAQRNSRKDFLWVSTESMPEKKTLVQMAAVEIREWNFSLPFLAEASQFISK
jgi:hypothetical protein